MTSQHPFEMASQRSFEPGSATAASAWYAYSPSSICNRSYLVAAARAAAIALVLIGVLALVVLL
jgi:hypothetical protein